MSNSGVFENVDDEINALKEQIGLLEEKIKGFDVDAKNKMIHYNTAKVCAQQTQYYRFGIIAKS